MTIKWRYPTLLVAAFLATGLAHAGSDTKTISTAAKPAAANSGAADAAVMLYVDPETGRTTSTPVTPEQKHAAANAMPTPDYSKIKEIHKADGSIEWQFNGQVQDFLVATHGADGKVKMTCSEHGSIEEHEAANTGKTVSGGRDVK